MGELSREERRADLRRAWDGMDDESRFEWLAFLTMDYVDRYEDVLRIIPECPSHGGVCLPHIEHWLTWVVSHLDETGVEVPDSPIVMDLFTAAMIMTRRQRRENGDE